MEQFAHLPFYIVINIAPASSFGTLWNIKCCSQSLSRIAMRTVFCLAETWPAGIIPKAQMFASPCHTLSDFIYESYILETHGSFVACFCGLAAILTACFGLCLAVWASPRSHNRWWHSLACAVRWWHQFSYHKASSKWLAFQSYPTLGHCCHTSDVPL